MCCYTVCSSDDINQNSFISSPHYIHCRTRGARTHEKQFSCAWPWKKLLLSLWKSCTYSGNLIIESLFRLTCWPTSYGPALLSISLADKQSLFYFTQGICLIMNVCADTETFSSTNLIITVSLFPPFLPGVRAWLSPFFRSHSSFYLTHMCTISPCPLLSFLLRI